MRSLAAILAISLLPASAMARDYGTIRGPFSVRTTTGVPYVSRAAPASARAADVLDECTPASGPWGPPYPGLILIHGGGWTGGSRNGASGNLILCQYWASWGFSAVTIDYRLIRDNDPTTYWPAQVFDAQAAVRWMRANATTLRLNPQQIIASGDSAGGTLAQYLGYQPYTITITGSGKSAFGEVSDEVIAENAAMNPSVQAVISEFGPTTESFGPIMSRDGVNPMQFSRTPLGTTPTQQTILLALYWMQLNTAKPPQNPVPPATADTLLVQGNADTTVQPLQAQSLYELLAAFGRPRNYYGFSGGHEYTGTVGGGIGDLYWTIRQAEVAFAYSHCHYAGCVPTSQPGPVGQSGKPVPFRTVFD